MNQTAFRLDIFTDNGKIEHLYLETLENLSAMLGTIDIVKAYRQHTNSIFLLAHVFDGGYNPIERVRYNDKEAGWSSMPVFYNKEKNIALSAADIDASLTYSYDQFTVI